MANITNMYNNLMESATFKTDNKTDICIYSYKNFANNSYTNLAKLEYFKANCIRSFTLLEHHLSYFNLKSRC